MRSLLKKRSIGPLRCVSNAFDVCEVHHPRFLAGHSCLSHVIVEAFEAQLLDALNPCQVASESDDAHAKPLNLIDARAEHLASELS